MPGVTYGMDSLGPTVFDVALVGEFRRIFTLRH